MKRFIGVKLINAKPMTRLEYNIFRGWELPKNENGDDKGFIVEYVDGGNSDTEKYEGYVSWSPEDVFIKAYFEVPENGVDIELKDNYEDWQKRVIKEYSLLDGKIDKLKNFIDAGNGNSLMDCQLKYMCGYAVILEKRIENF